MAVLDELSAAIGTIAGSAGGSVVRIGGGWRGGSGIVIADGRVVTNAHNVRSDEVLVAFADGRTAPGQVAGLDADGDLAVVSVDTSGVAPLPWGPGEAPGLGTPVFAVTASGSGARVTFGLISGVSRSFRGPRGRRISGSLEHTAPMPPGSSGSALVDASGALVGINTNRLEGGLYLALPADAALRERIEGLGRGEVPSRPRLGVGIAPSHVARRMRRAVGLPERDGLLVREVEAGSAAERAGLAAGDLLVAVDGTALGSADDLVDALGRAAQAGSAELTVVRGADERSVRVELA